MDLKPYLKLMIDKKADNLFLTANLAPCLEFSGQKKSVGQNKLSSDVLDTLFNDLTNEAQRLQYSIDNQVTVSAHLLDNQEFIIDISEKNDKYTITISKGQSSVAVIDSSLENIQVLGTAPKDNTLNILPYLQKIVELDGSDLFITAGSAVKTKIHGSAVALDNFLLTPEMTESAAHAIMDERQIKEFKETHDLDFAISLPDGSARFRVNAFYQRRTVGIVLRLIPMIIPTTQDLDLPDSLPELIMAKRGLLLMVGSTGSGKSTSLAAMINHRNMNVAGHILTIEDPVEFSHPNLKSIVNQREVGIDTVSYARALKASLREAPDVILI
ncbi:MAG: twitching motility protein, partial [Methyloprofundus sp.]|nr:twitching motility protein [Methyloprofundus sp.]